MEKQGVNDFIVRNKLICNLANEVVHIVLNGVNIDLNGENKMSCGGKSNEKVINVIIMKKKVQQS